MCTESWLFRVENLSCMVAGGHSYPACTIKAAIVFSLRRRNNHREIVWPLEAHSLSVVMGILDPRAVWFQTQHLVTEVGWRDSWKLGDVFSPPDTLFPSHRY